MRIHWTLPAADNLQSIKTYLDLHQPQFTRSTALRLYEGIRSLKSMRSEPASAFDTARERSSFTRSHTSSATGSWVRQWRSSVSITERRKEPSLRFVRRRLLPRIVARVKAGSIVTAGTIRHVLSRLPPFIIGSRARRDHHTPIQSDR